MTTPAIDINNIQAAKTVDARSSACPGPLLEAKKGIGGVKVGEILEIWAGDPVTKGNISKWCGKVGHEYLGAIEADAFEKIFIRRKK